jgi:hypothetical protein
MCAWCSRVAREVTKYIWQTYKSKNSSLKLRAEQDTLTSRVAIDYVIVVLVDD